MKKDKLKMLTGGKKNHPGQQVYDSLVKFYGVDGFDLYPTRQGFKVVVYYPKIVVKGTRESHQTELLDHYIKFFMAPDGTLYEKVFHGMTTSLSSLNTQKIGMREAEMYEPIQFARSHGHGGGYLQWGGYCTGTGPINKVMDELLRGFTQGKFEMFLTSLKAYLEWTNYGDLMRTREVSLLRKSLAPLEVKVSDITALLKKLVAKYKIQDLVTITPAFTVLPKPELAKALEDVGFPEKFLAYRDSAGNYFKEPFEEYNPMPVLEKMKARFEHKKTNFVFNGETVVPKFIIETKNEVKTTPVLRPEIPQLICRRLSNELQKKRISALKNPKRGSTAGNKRKTAKANNGTLR